MTRERARRRREGGEAASWADSLGAGAVASSWEASVFARAERSILEGNIQGLRACAHLWPAMCARRGAADRTLLHSAALAGSAQAVELLLQLFGAEYGRHVEVGQSVELFQDAFGITAGELAFAAGHQDVFDLLVTSACDRPRPSNFSSEHNKAYVKQKLKYEGDVLYDADGKGIMMGWETPLMVRHADLIAPAPGRSVLNVGFGLGIIDGLLEERRPRSHCISEAHPDVYAEIKRRGWLDKGHVQVCFGRWQDAADQIASCGPFDGIFFDTWAEMYGDMLEFFMRLPRILRPGGRFSFFNGMSEANIFAQAISCRCSQMDLSKLGFVCMFEPVHIGSLEEEWRKVVLQYWSLETYYAPVALYVPDGKPLTPEDISDLQTSGSTLRPNAVQVGDRVGACLEDKLRRAASAGFWRDR